MATRIKDIIKYYIRHNVSDKLKERVLDRVSNTRDDGETNEVLREVWNQADSAYMEEEEISTAYNRIFETKDTKEKTEMKTHRILYITRVAAVVVPLLILIIFGKLYVQMSQQLKEAQTTTLLQEQTNNEETKNVVLADGTKVKLYQSSVLLYSSAFNKTEERRVFLSGEAFFDIKHNDAQPFHVRTPHFKITDMGTSFAVSSYTDDNEVSATLKTGKIELCILGQEDKIYRLNPNDQLIYNVKTKEVNLRKVPDDFDGMSWHNKKIDLNDVTLLEATRILEQNFGIKFTFQSKLHQNTKITVHFNCGETLKGTMSIIEDLIPGLQYEIRNNEVFIR